jgi:hypothetical protein
MEGYCSTGQSPQWAVVSVEEEEEEEEEEVCISWTIESLILLMHGATMKIRTEKFNLLLIKHSSSPLCKILGSHSGDCKD